MGAEQSSNNKNSNKNSNKISEKDAIINGILKMTKKLYKKYHSKLNNVELCEKLALVTVDKLTQFDFFTLKKLSNSLDKDTVSLRPILIPDTNENKDLFELEDNSLSEDLPDYFYNKYVSVPSAIQSNKKIDVPYISENIISKLNQKGGDNKQKNTTCGIK